MIVVDGVERVDVHEAAALAGRSPETVRRWVWSGRVDAVKSGNKLLVRRSDIAPSRAPEDDHLSLGAWQSLLAPADGSNAAVSARDLIADDRDARARR
jgi:excisionase family DNA binding protein